MGTQMSYEGSFDIYSCEQRKTTYSLDCSGVAAPNADCCDLSHVENTALPWASKAEAPWGTQVTTTKSSSTTIIRPKFSENGTMHLTGSYDDDEPGQQQREACRRASPTPSSPEDATDTAPAEAQPEQAQQRTPPTRLRVPSKFRTPSAGSRPAWGAPAEGMVESREAANEAHLQKAQQNKEKQVAGKEEKKRKQDELLRGKQEQKKELQEQQRLRKYEANQKRLEELEAVQERKRLQDEKRRQKREQEEEELAAKTQQIQDAKAAQKKMQEDAAASLLAEKQQKVQMVKQGLVGERTDFEA